MKSIKNRIKILHLIKSLGRGGAEKLIPETALVHDHGRFEFYCIYFYHQENNIVEELEKAGIKVVLIPSNNLGLFFQVNKVRDFIRSHSIDLIHAHLPWAGILARSVGRSLTVPIVYTEHNTWERYNLVSYWGNRLSFKAQDVAIAVSNEVALSMRLNSMWNPNRRDGRMKVKVIQNGVNTEVFKKIEQTIQYPILESENQDLKIKDQDSSVKGQASSGKTQVPNIHVDARSEKGGQITENYSPTLKTALGIPESSLVIGKVAVFRTQKRLWLWVDLALAILKECPETHFLLVGDGEWRDRILRQIEVSGKAKNFHWVGVQKDVIPYLSIMDIYLSSSEFEGLPIAMLEAMSCEVAVVATTAGGIGEVILHGYHGYLSEIEEWEKLSGYCVELIKNPELHQKMAKAARRRVIEGFSMKRMVRELEETYEEVLKGKRA